MSWQTTGAIEERVGALGIVVSLVYLATRIPEDANKTPNGSERR